MNEATPRDSNKSVRLLSAWKCTAPYQETEIQADPREGKPLRPPLPARNERSWEGPQRGCEGAQRSDWRATPRNDRGGLPHR